MSHQIHTEYACCLMFMYKRDKNKPIWDRRTIVAAPSYVDEKKVRDIIFTLKEPEDFDIQLEIF